MFRALYTAASGMIAQQYNLDNVANNLANASTGRLPGPPVAVRRPHLPGPGRSRRRFHTTDQLFVRAADRFGDRVPLPPKCFRLKATLRPPAIRST